MKLVKKIFYIGLLFVIFDLPVKAGPYEDGVEANIKWQRMCLYTEKINTIKKVEKGVGRSAPNAKMTTVQKPVIDDPVNNIPTTPNDDSKAFSLWNKFFKGKKDKNV